MLWLTSSYSALNLNYIEHIIQISTFSVICYWCLQNQKQKQLLFELIGAETRTTTTTKRHQKPLMKLKTPFMMVREYLFFHCHIVFFFILLDLCGLLIIILLVLLILVMFHFITGRNGNCVAAAGRAGCQGVEADNGKRQETRGGASVCWCGRWWSSCGSWYGLWICIV